MAVNSDEIQLLTMKPDVLTEKNEVFSKSVKIDNNKRNIEKTQNPIQKPANTDNRQNSSSRTTLITTQRDLDAEDRQRTGRYLAVGVTLVMLFIAFYHTILRHTTVLAGLLAPAIIMLLYILWLLYFAKKKKRPVAVV